MQPISPLIVFGTRPRQSTLDEGHFICPNCSREPSEKRRYELKNVRNYFTIYFIPLIPMGKGDEIVQCQNCGMTFAPEVLDANVRFKRKQRPLAEQLNRLQERLENGYPVEYAVRDLTEAGLDREMARQNVQQAIGGARNTCPTCQLTYAPAVERCAEDETVLV